MNKQLKVGALLNYISLFLSIIIGIVYTPFMLSQMGTSEYGLYALALSIVSYLNILDNGFSAGVVRYVSYYRERQDYESINKIINSSFLIYLILGGVCLCLGAILYNIIEAFYIGELNEQEIYRLKCIVLILMVYISFNLPASVFVSVITACEDFILLKTAKIVQTLLVPMIMTPLLLQGYRSIAMSVVTTSIGISITMFYVCYCMKKYPFKYSVSYINYSTLKEMILFATPMLMIITCDCVCRSFGSFYIGAYGGTIGVTILSLSIQLRGYFESFVKAISSFFLPHFTKMIAAKSDITVISNDFIKISRLEFHIAFILLSGFIWFGIFFLEFWTSNIEVLEIFICSLIIIVPLLFSMAESVGEEIVKAYNKQNKQLYIYVFRAVIVLIITFIFTKKYSFYACAFAIGFSAFVCDIVLMNLLYAKSIKLNVHKLLKSILPSIFFVLIGVGLKFFIFNKLSLIIQLLAFLVYSLFYIIICLNKDEKKSILALIFFRHKSNEKNIYSNN